MASGGEPPPPPAVETKRICVVGAGAIGGLLGARIALRTPHEVTLIARGAHLAAMRARGGVRLIDREGGEEMCSRVTVTDSWAGLPEFDVVFLAMKVSGLAAAPPRLEAICKDDTVVVPLQNGVPWWYFFGHGGALDGTRLASVDHDGQLAAHIRHDRLVGCIAFPAAEIVAPGVIKWVEGRAFPLGEPDRSVSARATALSAILEQAGFLAPVRPDFRAEVWLKLLGNAAFNPISALTRTTLAELLHCPASFELCRGLMGEVAAVAAAVGCKLRVPVDRRLERSREVLGDHRTSMLQDIEAGKVGTALSPDLSSLSTPLSL
eukprot:SAG22_NODE_2684_length_2312_cov_1.270221_3_plen_321_part_00